MFHIHKHLFSGSLLGVVAGLCISATPVSAEESSQWLGSGEWSGFHAGVHLGGVLLNSKGVDQNAIFDTFDSQVKGGLIGLQLGVNRQQEQWIFGLESDLSLGNIQGTHMTSIGLIAETNVDYIATLRPRVGRLFGNTLAYATTGIAFSRMEAEFQGNPPSDKKTHTGFTVGAGLEHRLSSKLSVKGDWLYTNFNSKVYSASGGQASLDPDGHLLRVGLNYSF
ncbi:outer membrane protein [Magnetococcus sp. PR-3]|uniref:outer membrane protein n=1 Tax=Magnetococcus sp. PR-3 TaxID=3120355 RepID=UPI002FCDE381